MDTLPEIEAAVDGLPLKLQRELFRHLAERPEVQGESKRRLPLVASTGNPITQEDIDEALDAD